MTVADWIRSMDDTELATFFTMVLSERDKIMCEKLAVQGVSHTLVEMPLLSVAQQLEYLQSEMEGEET